MIFQPEEISYLQDLKDVSLDLAHVVSLLTALAKRGEQDTMTFIDKVNIEFKQLGFRLHGDGENIGIENS